MFNEIISNAKPFGLARGNLKMERDTLFISSVIWKEHLFDKVINPMIDHVHNLIKEVNLIKDKDGKQKQVKYLCIAGGLSSSKYFQHRVREAFGMESKYKLSIRIPRRPILSVIDGALKLGLRPNYIKTRRVKYTYGIAVDRSEKNVDLKRLPHDYLPKNGYIHPNTNKRTIRNLFSAFVKRNGPVQLEEAIEKEYRRFHKNEKTSKISIYYSNDDDPYVIKEDQKPLASVTITFPDQYEGLKFTVQFFFGDTRIRAKVVYKDKKEKSQNEKEILMEDLKLDFYDLYVN